MAWLGIGDQLAPVVVAGTGALSFGWTVVASRRQTGQALPRLRHAAEKMRLRRYSGWAVAAGCLTLLAALIQLSSILSAVYDLPLSLVASFSGVLTLLLVLAGHITARRDELMPLASSIRTILDHEKRRSESHRYSFGSMHIPSVSKLYVPRRAQSWEWSQHQPTPHYAATETITLDAMLARYKHLVIVSGPGGGKSTIASWVVGQTSRWWLNAVRRQNSASAPYGAAIALYIHANELTGEGLEESIASRYINIGVKELSPDDFRKSPLPGVDWLVFVDGVDELLEPSRRSKILNVLGTYVYDSHGPIRLAVTSRPLSTGELAELHTAEVGQMYLHPFDRDDIREFARNWFIARADYRAEVKQVEETVDDFVNCVRRSGLGGMMRVPLLVAMAALVYERDSSSELPTTRGDLYREYISLLLSARHAEVAEGDEHNYQKATSFPSSFSVWLHGVLPDLLLALAIARVEDVGRSLMRVARAWVRDQLSSGDFDEPEWPWIGLLQSALISTSVLEAVGSDVEFLHHSIAEYLAADPQVRGCGYEDLKKELADPARRSLALFTLARSGERASPIVVSLLEVGDSLSASHVLAEGFRVDEALRQATITGLLNRIREEHPSAVECLAVLTELAIDQRICAHLTAVVEDASEGPWTRALIADSLAELYPDLGARLLREVATDRRTGHEPSRVWATQRLRARGDEFASRIKREIGLDISRESHEDGRLAEHALRTIALDARTPPDERVEAATRLCDNGDAVGAEVLRQIAWSSELDASERARAARLLIERGDIAGRAVLEGLAKDKAVDESERRMAASLLTDEDGHTEVSVLRERARDRGLDPWRRRMAAELLARRKDPTGLDVLRTLVDDDRIDSTERYEAARTLTRYGDPVGVEYLEWMSQDYQGGNDERYSAAAALTQSNSKGGPGALEKLAKDENIDPWERRMAAQVLFFKTGDQISIDALASIAENATIDAYERYEAARVLIESGQPAGFEVLRELASDAAVAFRVRYASSLALLEKGEKVGFVIMRSLARDLTYTGDDRRLAARILAEYHDETGLVTLRELARSYVASVSERRQAALALAKLGDLEGMQILQELLDS